MSHWSHVINEYYKNWRSQLVPMKPDDLKIIQEQYRQQQLINQYNATAEAVKAVKAKNKGKKNRSEDKAIKVDKRKPKRGRPRKGKINE